MSKYKVHTIESAPEKSQDVLKKLKGQIGVIPNLAGSMAESPVLIDAFITLRGLWYEKGTFNEVEKQVLALTNAFENRCEYCMSLHSAFALKAGLSTDSLARLRDGKGPVESKYKALSEFSRKMVKTRGHVSEADIEEFVAAGYTRAQALEVVAGVAVSILPNFSHHLTGCAVDDMFKEQLWKSV